MSEKIKGGLADGKPDKQYPESQLKKGIKVEMEHTDDPSKAKEIAKDHLEEGKDYYTRLAKMEKDMEKNAFFRGFEKQSNYTLTYLPLKSEEQQNKFRKRKMSNFAAHLGITGGLAGAMLGGGFPSGAKDKLILGGAGLVGGAALGAGIGALRGRTLANRAISGGKGVFELHRSRGDAVNYMNTMGEKGDMK